MEAIKLWECNIGDDGVAHLCEFLKIENQVESLDLLRNKITAVGAEFLGRVLGPPVESKVNNLHLDFNPIGSVGVEKLANGIAQNKALTVISLTHCNLDSKCAPAICRILIYIESKLKELDLSSNELRSSGLIEICPAASIAKSLASLNVADNLIEDNAGVYDNLGKLVQYARSLKRIDIGNNFLSNEGIKLLLPPLATGQHITDINFGIKLDAQIRLELKPILVENKKIAKKAKKKKKGKKGKKGKKKKKK